jgi:hypothetical protein
MLVKRQSTRKDTKNSTHTNTQKNALEMLIWRGFLTETALQCLAARGQRPMAHTRPRPRASAPCAPVAESCWGEKKIKKVKSWPKSQVRKMKLFWFGSWNRLAISLVNVVNARVGHSGQVQVLCEGLIGVC